MTTVLFALQLPLSGKDCLDEFALWRILEFEIQTFHGSAEFGKPMAQHEMEDRIAREALQVIENDDIIMLRMSLKVVQQSDHARPVHEISTP
nr:hypothetical protein [Aquisalinus luteolus]